jgi:hypothetical protein
MLLKAESQAEAAPGLPKFALMPMSSGFLLIHIALHKYLKVIGSVFRYSMHFSPNLISPLLWLVILARSCFVKATAFP